MVIEKQNVRILIEIYAYQTSAPIKFIIHLLVIPNIFVILSFKDDCLRR